MRDLSATSLEANQKAMIRPILAKLVLVSGGTIKTYDLSSTTNRILSISHREQEWSQLATVAIQGDATLAALDLKGYAATLSYGYNDATAGDEFSACAPLEVVTQHSTTDLLSQQSLLTTSFISAGIFDLMQADEASESYKQESSDQRTVKTLLTAVANATLTPFSHCKNYTISFDSDDSLIDSYIPADYFHVSKGESRLSAFKKLIGTTKCKAKIGDDGKIHVLDPTVSGSTYDYEYNDAATNHNFFEKSTRKRLVLPNRVYVESHPDQGSYTGNAIDTATYDALGRYINRYHTIRATSNTECTNIATAMLQHLQVGAEKGYGFVPMNCGQEVMDYVNITDSIASDERAGNIGYINRRYTPGEYFSMSFGFGKLAGEFPFMSPIDPSAKGLQSYVTWEQLYRAMDEWGIKLAEWVLEILADEIIARKITAIERMLVPGWDV